MSELSSEVSRHDQDIQMLQKHLKETETLLSTALYQARMKLDQISRAQAHSVNSEDLIRFAHRISSTNAVAAPTNWQPGDTRRPYPTDLEIRMGFLARMNELPINQVFFIDL
jgi:mediator of RNA polymerase II transcription subunit 4